MCADELAGGGGATNSTPRLRAHSTGASLHAQLQPPHQVLGGAKRAVSAANALEIAAGTAELPSEAFTSSQCPIRSLPNPTAAAQTSSAPPKPKQKLSAFGEAQLMGLLRKRAFSCTILGGRQTGKRTIVKCFVKLSNEFKLAANEYKKEQMLSKLVECSERLQELASAAAAAADEDELAATRRQSRQTRLNSFLNLGSVVGGGGSALKSRLMSLSSPSGSAVKRRLHSCAGLGSVSATATALAAGPRFAETALRGAAATTAGSAAPPATGEQQRRHTTTLQLEQVGGGGGGGRNEPLQVGVAGLGRLPRALANRQTANFLSVADSNQTSLVCGVGNKSDTSVNYTAAAAASGSEAAAAAV